MDTLDTVLRDNKCREAKYINAFCDDQGNTFYNQVIFKGIRDEYVKAFRRETSPSVNILKSFELPSLPSIAEVDRPLLTKHFSIQDI